MGKKSQTKSPPKKKPAPKIDAGTITIKRAAPKKTTVETPPSAQNLLKRQFERTVPDVLYTVPPDKVKAPEFTAPELTGGFSPEAATRVKALLTNTYSDADLTAAAEKAAAEKAAAEKAAAEKAAAEKAAAEKAAAEKAAAEKAAAEKAAAEKAAAEKAAAEKAAAEKAAAEKAAAEKAAAEKAAAEKAAAEKAEAERIAAEKAAAEKAASEKAAAEAAEAAKLKNRILKYLKDPVNRPILAIGGVMALVVLILVWASAANSGRYYAIEKKGALQIWKGEFSPTGKKIITVLPGVALPEPAKAVYGAAELYPLAFDYYMNRADALGNTQDVPDFDGIQTSLKAALSFSTTREMQRNVMDRLDTIDRTALTYKAAEAARLGTIEGLSAAISLLMESAQLTTDKAEKDIINQRIDAHHAAIAQIEAESANNQLDASDSSAETH